MALLCGPPKLKMAKLGGSFPQIVVNNIITGEIVEDQAYAQNMQVSDDERYMSSLWIKFL